MKNIILSSMKNTIDFLNHIKKVENGLDKIGLSLELFAGYGNSLEEYVNNNISLLWTLILKERDCPELDSNEFEWYKNLLYCLGYDNTYTGFKTPEDIYNYFTDTNRIANFNIGKED